MEEGDAAEMTVARTLRPVARVWRGLPNEGGVFCGTAFFIAPTRALTANHVVENADAQPIYLQVAWGASFVRVREVKAHGNSAEVDAALLTIDAQSAAGVDALVAIGDPLPLAIGMPIDIAGYADENGPAELRRTTVSAIEAVATAAIVQPLPARGMSGGPAL